MQKAVKAQMPTNFHEIIGVDLTELKDVDGEKYAVLCIG